MKPLAQEHTEIVRSENPLTEWTYSPHILPLDSGRLLASYDISCKMGYIKASDDGGKTLHIFSRAHTAGSGYCCMMKAVERIKDGKDVIEFECEKAPSGQKIVFLPMPGGQMKFYIWFINSGSVIK